MTQLYVGNLSADGDEKAIRALFSKYGVVREVLMKNGYAFVEYDDSYSAEEAMRALNGKLAVSAFVCCIFYGGIELELATCVLMYRTLQLNCSEQR